MAKQDVVSLASTLPSVTMAKAVAVIHAVSAGDTVTAACKTQMVSVAALRACCAREPELQAMLDEAITVRNEILSDMLINIDTHQSDAKMAAVISKNIQWVLERREPEKFAARIASDPSNEASRLLAEALNKALERVPLPRLVSPKMSDADYTIVEPTKPRVASIEELKVLGLI